jgi:hypothetical protein
LTIRPSLDLGIFFSIYFYHRDRWPIQSGSRANLQDHFKIWGD